MRKKLSTYLIFGVIGFIYTVCIVSCLKDFDAQIEKEYIELEEKQKELMRLQELEKVESTLHDTGMAIIRKIGG